MLPALFCNDSKVILKIAFRNHTLRAWGGHDIIKKTQCEENEMDTAKMIKELREGVK